MSLLSSLEELLPQGAGTALDLIRGRYPPFVYGSERLVDQVPVFCFHSVDPEPFETILRFLARNDYYTLTPGELAGWVNGRTELPQERAILLTFDDGHGSVWSVAYPLLRRFGMRATAFLVPSLMDDRQEYLPTLEDAQQGTANLETVLSREDGPYPYLTWDEISEMALSGALNFETHSHEHSLIFTSPKIVDFVRPELREQYDPLEFRIATGYGEPPTVGDLPLGAPLYTTAPRLSGEARYFDDRGLRQACVDFVAERGGDCFFDQRNWRPQLMSVVESYRKRHSLDEGYESADETRESIRLDLARSIEEIEDYPELAPVHFLAFPWNTGSALAVSEAKDLGLRGCFWENPGGRYINERGQDPFYFRRMGRDFLSLLPGKGRDTLLSLLTAKIQRRLTTPSPHLTHRPTSTSE
ncbi:MAG: polysaccharide deacetylase family protein [Salinibacter sp.]|uniref:polysaccharide deacetylase family protein n=1 Tax=Salinibacter sp. TaxID=2065818 RepID=UPI0035D50E63